MADGILVGGKHLCEADSTALWFKDGVVAKTFVSVALMQNLSFHDALEEMFLSLIY